MLEVAIDGEPVRAYRGPDFEAALQGARTDFESLGRLLLVNRFRRDAFERGVSADVERAWLLLG